MSSSFPIMNTMHLENTFESVNLLISPNEDPIAECTYLLDNRGRLLVNSEDDFIKILKIDPSEKIKVVSIIGNTGDGKSYTLNHTFFDGNEIFKTSSAPYPCTLGAWAKYNPNLKIICIDTEGFLGVTNRRHQRICSLQKIFAISDVIIYCTKSEHLPCDMYRFLAGASRTYKEYFIPTLENISQKYEIDKKSLSRGPSIIIFHETRYTKTLTNMADVETSPEDILRENFAKLGERCDGFSSLDYVGITGRSGKICFRQLRLKVESELQSVEMRSPRSPQYVYGILKVLDEKFQSLVHHSEIHLNLSVLFMCQDKCLSCGAGCNLAMGHQYDNEPHANTVDCKLHHQYQNFVYYCKNCLNSGIKQIVKQNYQVKNEKFLSNFHSTICPNYIIECPTCGKIYESRKYWYGNKDPKEAVVVDIMHAWPKDKFLRKSNNIIEKALGLITGIGNLVPSVGFQPPTMIYNWVTNQITPTSWRRNTNILEYHLCRACGESFCNIYSSRTQSVPTRDFYEKLKLCDNCYRRTKSEAGASDDIEHRS